MSTPAEHPEQRRGGVRVPELRIRTLTFVRWGIAAWLLTLAVLLLVPGLPGEDRGWWVWVPVAGVAVGGLGYAYLRRGEGVAA